MKISKKQAIISGGIGIGVLSFLLISSALVSGIPRTASADFEGKRHGHMSEEQREEWKSLSDEEREAKREERRAQKEAMKSSLESGDYAAWKSLVADRPVAEVITTEAQFSQLREVHELRKSGEHKEARDLAESLGLHGHGHGKHAK